MGYYTDYTVSIVSGEQDHDGTIERRLREISGYDVELGDYFNGKWYDCDFDMETVSREFPDRVFKVDGDGEERHDEWTKFYCNGTSSELFIAVKTFVYNGFDVEKFGAMNRGEYKPLKSHKNYTVSDEMANKAMQDLEVLEQQLKNVRSILDTHRKERD